MTPTIAAGPAQDHLARLTGRRPTRRQVIELQRVGRLYRFGLPELEAPAGGARVRARRLPQ